MTDKEIATQILTQLGGRRFTTMTGSHTFLWGSKTLSMHLRKNKLGAKYLSIELMGDDTYTLTFRKMVKFETKTLKTIEGVYAENLQEIFEMETGLYTKL